MDVRNQENYWETFKDWIPKPKGCTTALLRFNPLGWLVRNVEESEFKFQLNKPLGVKRLHFFKSIENRVFELLENRDQGIGYYEGKTGEIKYFFMRKKNTITQKKKIESIPLHYTLSSIIEKILIGKVRVISCGSYNFIIRLKTYHTDKDYSHILKISKISNKTLTLIIDEVPIAIKAKMTLSRVNLCIREMGTNPFSVTNSQPAIVELLKKDNGMLPYCFCDSMYSPITEQRGIQIQPYCGKDVFEWLNSSIGIHFINQYQDDFIITLLDANIYLDRIHYIHTDFKIENVGFFDSAFKILDFGEGVFLDENGKKRQISPEGKSDLRTPGTLSKIDFLSEPSQKTRSIPCIVMSLVNYLECKHKELISVKISYFLDVKQTQEKIEAFISNKRFPEKDRELLAYSLQILLQEAKNRPDPIQLKEGYMHILNKFRKA